jgi:hypothetical protein
MQKDCQLQYTFIAQAKFLNLSDGKDEKLFRARIFIQSIGSRNRVGIGLLTYCTGPPGYIGWWNSFLGIDSWAP